MLVRRIDANVLVVHERVNGKPDDEGTRTAEGDKQWVSSRIRQPRLLGVVLVNILVRMLQK